MSSNCKPMPVPRCLLIPDAEIAALTRSQFYDSWIRYQTPVTLTGLRQRPLSNLIRTAMLCYAMLCYAMLCLAMPVSPILAPIQRDAHHSPRHQFQCRSSSIPLSWLCVYVFVHLALIWSFLSSFISASPAQMHYFIYQYSIQYWKGL